MSEIDVKKKIIIVSRSFFPQISPRSFRTTELVKEFSRLGHSVTLYTSKNNSSHIEFEKEYGITIVDIGKPMFKEVNMNVNNKFLLLYKKLLRRGLLWLAEYPDIGLMFQMKSALKNVSGYDLLISIAAPHPVHWGTAWAWNKNKKIASTWIADCGDPYMGVPYEKYKKPLYFKFLEKSFCKKADYVAITNINMKQNYYSEFHNKIIEIPQGFQFDNINTNVIPDEKGVIKFAFAGTLMKDVRDPQKFLNYLTKINIPFKFKIYTKQTHLVEPYLKVLKDKIEISDYIPRDKLIAELSKMDFLVNFEYDPFTQSPSKLIDYYLTGRPILSLESKNFDEKLVDEFLNRDYSRKFELVDIQKYNIKNVAQKFLERIK